MSEVNASVVLCGAGIISIIILIALARIQLAEKEGLVVSTINLLDAGYKVSCGDRSIRYSPKKYGYVLKIGESSFFSMDAYPLAKSFIGKENIDERKNRIE